VERTVRIVVTTLAFLLGTSLSHAGPADDCNQVRDLNRQLRGCTAYIKQGSGEPQNLATAHLNRANIYAQRGKYTLAFADYASAIALDPRNPLAPYNRGNAYFDTGQFELAITDFTRAIELAPRFALAYFNRGLAHERRGDNNAAAEDYRRALTLDPAAEAPQERLKLLQSQ
jgi:tetratricopeptide (TPR) repeat protein